MTKAQRHKIYKETLKKIKEDVQACICLTMDLGCPNREYEIRYPEFGKQKPNNKTWGMVWFKENKAGQQKRIAILKKCIKETAPKKK